MTCRFATAYVAATAAMNHDPDRAVVAIDLHLDEVVAAADRAQLRQRFVARAADAVGVECVVVEWDVLALANIGIDTERSRPIARDFLDVALIEARHVPRAMAADARRDPR